MIAILASSVVLIAAAVYVNLALDAKNVVIRRCCWGVALALLAAGGVLCAVGLLDLLALRAD